MKTTILTVLVAGVLIVSATANAVTIQVGDLLVADAGRDQIESSEGRIIKIDPVTGQQTLISVGGLLTYPRDIVQEASGQLLVTEAFGPIIRVNPITGAQSIVAGSNGLVQPIGIALDQNGKIIVVDRPGFVDRVVRIDEGMSSQTVISSGGSFAEASGVTVRADGQIFVADFQSEGSRGLGVYQVDPITGSQTLIKRGLPFADPWDLVLESFTSIIVSDASAFGGPGAIFRVDIGTGSIQTVSSLGLLVNPQGLDLEVGGSIVVAEPGIRRARVDGTERIVRVDTTTGTQTLVSIAGFMLSPTAVAVAKYSIGIPEPTTLAILGLGLAGLGVTRRRRSA